MAVEAVTGATAIYQGSLPSNEGKAESLRKSKENEVLKTETVAEQSAAVVTDTNKSAQNKESEENGKQKQSDHAQLEQTEQIKKAVKDINKSVVGTQSEAIFGIHEKTNRVTIKIVDKKTKEVLKEFPPEKTLDMIAKVWENAGIMVDEKR